MTQQQPGRLHCPNCGRFLGAAPGYIEAPTCKCGCQVTRREDGTIVQRFPRPGEQLRPRFMERVTVKA